jgi:hypothetical protein
MIRKLCTALAILATVTGLALVASPAEASVIPQHGNYKGTDHGGRMVTMSFAGNQMSHLTVGHQYFGGAHVSNGMWHETCANGWCSKGQWSEDGRVTGSWRHGSSSTWTPFTVMVENPIRPYQGTYMGHDHRGLGVHLSFNGSHVMDFTWDSNVIGSASVSGDAFQACHRNFCFKGHWQSAHEVVGSWWYQNAAHDTHPWEAWAYSH